MTNAARNLLGCAILVLSGAHAAEAPEPDARFHHVHLNSTDPSAAIDFYASKFKARREKFAGQMDAVWTGDSWLLFTKVDSPPPAELISGIWHIGWGAEDMQSTYRRQLDSGTRFATPITDISEMVGGNRPFFYAYVDGPDHALIELNTAKHHNFGHVHMFSADPPAAGAWYARHFGWRFVAQKDKREFRGIQIAPAAFVTADHVSMIIYPVEYLRAAAPAQWQERRSFATTRGRVIDHLGFAVADLDAALAALRRDGVVVAAPPTAAPGGQLRHAFIEGPDQVAIELVEDRSPAPASIAE